MYGSFLYSISIKPTDRRSLRESFILLECFVHYLSLLIKSAYAWPHLFTASAEVRIRLTTKKVGELKGDMQGLQFIDVWVGSLASDWIRFPESCRNH